MAGSHTVPSAREAGPLDGQPCSPSEVCRTGKIRDRAPRGGPTDDCRRGGENDRAMSRYPAVPDPRGENCLECPLRARQINTNRLFLLFLASTRSLCDARARDFRDKAGSFLTRGNMRVARPLGPWLGSEFSKGVEVDK